LVNLAIPLIELKGDSMVSLLQRWLLVCALAMAGSVLAIPDDGPRVNINSANAETIAEVLDGIGLIKAEAIVRYRTEVGEFRDVYELANVKGVGERTVKLNEARITLED